MNEIDVVIVDDVKDAASTYADMVSAVTGLVVRGYQEPNEVLTLAAGHRVPVYVLDASMPGMDGVTLFGEIKKIDPEAEGILITGEAGRDKIGAGIGAFSAYLEKDDIKSLPELVLKHYVAYVKRSAIAHRNSTLKTLHTRRHGFLWTKRIIYRLISSQLLEAEYSIDSDWTNVAELSPGQQISQTITVERKREMVFESESTEKIASKMGFSVKKFATLTSELQTELASRTKVVGTQAVASTATLTISHSLTQAPEDPTKNLHVTLCRIQQAPAYRRYRTELEIECDCCQVPRRLTEIVLVPTGNTSLRRIEYLSDGSKTFQDFGSN